MQKKRPDLGRVAAGFFTTVTLLWTLQSPSRTSLRKTILHRFHNHLTALLCIPKLKVNLKVYLFESVTEVQ